MFLHLIKLAGWPNDYVLDLHPWTCAQDIHNRIGDIFRVQHGQISIAVYVQRETSCLRYLRFHTSRTNVGDPDLVLLEVVQFVAQGLYQSIYRVLCSRIDVDNRFGGQYRHYMTSSTRYVDNVAGTVAINHRLESLFSARHHSHEIRIDDHLHSHQIVVVQERTVVEDSSIVDQNVNTPIIGHHKIKCRFYILLLGQIALVVVKLGINLATLDFFLQLLETIFSPGQTHHNQSMLAQVLTNSCTDPSTCTGDNRYSITPLVHG